jgi:hypothetical protein
MFMRVSHRFAAGRSGALSVVVSLLVGTVVPPVAGVMQRANAGVPAKACYADRTGTAAA